MGWLVLVWALAASGGCLYWWGRWKWLQQQQPVLYYLADGEAAREHRLWLTHNGYQWAVERVFEGVVFKTYGDTPLEALCNGCLKLERVKAVRLEA